MLDKCRKNVGWKFISFLRAIQLFSFNMQVLSFFHSMSNQRWWRTWNPLLRYRSNLFCHSHLSQFPQPFPFSVSFVYFLWFCLPFFSHYIQLLLQHLHIPPHVVPAISIGGQNLLRSCSSSFPFDVRDTCDVRFSFVESFPIRTSNVRNDVVRTKRWMEQETDPTWNLCWMSLKTLDEKFTCDHGFFFFHATRFFLFLPLLLSIKPIQHFIQYGILFSLDEMLDRLNKVFKHFENFTVKRLCWGLLQASDLRLFLQNTSGRLPLRDVQYIFETL